MDNVYDRYSLNKGIKIKFSNGKHISNKQESKKLRQIMSDTGMIEEEIRSIKKYRIELSKAQKEDQKSKHTKVAKFYKRKIKEACKITGLAKEHPNTIEVLEKLLTKEKNSMFGAPHYMWGFDPKQAHTIVKDY